MIKLYGVSFKTNGKVYFFKTTDLELKLEDKVIVETEKGFQYGKIVSFEENSSSKIKIENLKNIERKATEKDETMYLKNLADAKKALQKASELILDLDLEMSLVDVVYSFDRKQLLFTFLADERIDFRELVKQLASIYHTRIELRQIGVRDKAKEVGGLGQCGRKLCCASFLNHMETVTINQAKNQNIALNPTKINGSCGRLLCCLNFEDDEYSQCRRYLPQIGQIVQTKKGKGQVISLDILNKQYVINVDGEKIIIDQNSNLKKDEEK